MCVKFVHAPPVITYRVWLSKNADERNDADIQAEKFVNLKIKMLQNCLIICLLHNVDWQYDHINTLGVFQIKFLFYVLHDLFYHFDIELL